MLKIKASLIAFFVIFGMLWATSPAQADFGHGYAVNRDANNNVTISGFNSSGDVRQYSIGPGASADSNHTFDVERVFISPGFQMTIEWWRPNSSGALAYYSKKTYYNYSETNSITIVVADNYTARVVDYRWIII